MSPPKAAAALLVALTVGSPPATVWARTPCPSNDGAQEVRPAIPPAPPLDLASLEKRLRDTRAMGILTKIALKNQVDDLLAEFQRFHTARGGLTLVELRERFNLLFLKVLSLVQDDDPGLARDIAASRTALWTALTDPAQFAHLTGGKAQ